MVSYEAAVTIEAPPERVWAVLTDHERLPRWVPAVNASTVIAGAVGLVARGADPAGLARPASRAGRIPPREGAEWGGARVGAIMRK